MIRRLRIVSLYYICLGAAVVLDLAWAFVSVAHPQSRTACRRAASSGSTGGTIMIGRLSDDDFFRLYATNSELREQNEVEASSNSTSRRALEGCICLVTGASRGIGKGIALELGRQGALVYATGTSSLRSNSSSNRDTRYDSSYSETGPGTVEETAEQVTAIGGTGIAVYCNHAVDEEVEQLMQRIEKEQGRLDILINNCFRMPKGGVENLNKKFWQQDLDTWDSLHQVGLRSHYVASYFAMPLLIRSAKASEKPKGLARPLIGMIGSFGGLTYTFNLPYGVGKAGVDRLVKDMAIEVADEDICVVSFWPGVVLTERTKIAVANGDWQKHVGVPLDNAESPEFTGKAIVAVATDPENMRKTGKYQVVAELAQEYGFTDIDGSTPPSIRSLRFLIPSYGMDEETREKVPSWLIPDWKLPFWVMAQGGPPPPKEE